MRNLEGEKKDLTTKYQLAIQNTVSAVKSENRSATIPTNEEVEKKHIDELKVLEERLRAEHKKELEAAVANAVPGGTVEKSKEADIEVAIASAKAELNKRHEEEIEKAIDRGRKEVQTKLRLKDAQLTRTQARVKELEATILELQAAPATSTSKTTTAAPAQKPTSSQPLAQKPPPSAQTPGQKPTPALNKPQQATAQNRLPNRPTPLTRGGGPGRVSNVAFGGRGGAPTTTQAPQSTGGGVSIMGAAKRPREDAEGEMSTTDNSLIKRLKPAENKPTPPVKRPPPKQ